MTGNRQVNFYNTYKVSTLSTRTCASACFTLEPIPDVMFTMNVLRLNFGARSFPSAFLGCEALGVVYERGFALPHWKYDADMNCEAELERLSRRLDFATTVLAPLAQKVAEAMGRTIEAKPEWWR